MTTAIATRKDEPTDIVQHQPHADPMMSMIERAAADPNFDAGKLQQLLDAKERYEANEARKAWVVAMSAFKADAPTIDKNKRVSFATAKGKTEYDHATLDNVCNVVIAALSKHGLSHRWETMQEGSIAVTCVITHILGHSERTTLRASADDSGGKNSIQAIGSTVTYLQRYTLLAAAGLAVKGMDNDGKGADAEFVAPDKVKEIADLMPMAGFKTDIAKSNFIKWLFDGEERPLSEMNIHMYRKALSHLNNKMREKAAPKGGANATDNP